MSSESTIAGIIVGLVVPTAVLPFTTMTNPGFSYIQVQPSEEVFEVPLYDNSGKSTSQRLNEQNLSSDETLVSLNSKRIRVDNTWVRVKGGFIYSPGVREPKPKKRVFTVSVAPVPMTQRISTPSREGNNFYIDISYIAQIQGEGSTVEEENLSRRKNAAKFIVKTLGSVDPNNPHTPVDVASKLKLRIANMFNEESAKITSEYNQLEIGANKTAIINELYSVVSEKALNEFGVTISQLNYGGTEFTSATQQKIDNNALASIRKDIGTISGNIQRYQSQITGIRKSAFSGNQSEQFLLQDKELSIKKDWVDAMSKGIESGNITNPSTFLPDSSLTITGGK